MCCIGVLPFIEGSLKDGTSGLVAVSRDSEEQRLGRAFLKGPRQCPDGRLPVCGLVIAETPSGHCLMGAHAY